MEINMNKDHSYSWQSLVQASVEVNPSTSTGKLLLLLQTNVAVGSNFVATGGVELSNEFNSLGSHVMGYFQFTYFVL